MTGPAPTRPLSTSLSTPWAERERRERRIRLAVALRLFAELDFDEGAAGHLSVRDPERHECFWMNPIGEPFELLGPRDLVLVDGTNGLVVAGEGAVDAGGVRMHTAIYHARHDVTSVMHAHPVHGKAWSALGRPLDPISQEACIFFDAHALYDNYNGPVTDAAEAQRIAAALGSNKAVILRNHALVTVGDCVDAAAFRFVILDRSCRVQLLAEAAGTPRPIPANIAAGLSADQQFCRRSFQPLYKRLIARHPDLLEL